MLLQHSSALALTTEDKLLHENENKMIFTKW